MRITFIFKNHIPIVITPTYEYYGSPSTVDYGKLIQLLLSNLGSIKQLTIAQFILMLSPSFGKSVKTTGLTKDTTLVPRGYKLKDYCVANKQVDKEIQANFSRQGMREFLDSKIYPTSDFADNDEMVYMTYHGIHELTFVDREQSTTIDLSKAFD